MTIADVSLYASLALLVGSEVIALNPKWKSNSLVQLAGNILKKVAGK